MGVGTEIAIALIFWAICAVCALCIAANIIARICRKSPTEDEADELANGRSPAAAGSGCRSFGVEPLRVSSTADIPNAITNEGE